MATSTRVGCTEGECGLRVKRVYKLESSFWEEGNLEREIWAKQLAVDLDEDEGAETGDQTGMSQFKCQIAGCNKWFRSIPAYENHYNTAHRYSCNTCRRMFPTARLLEIHILETHDSLFALLAKKQKMYECLVPGCEQRFATDKDREKHLIDLHHYPKEFAFHYRRRRRYARKKKGKKRDKGKNKARDQQTAAPDPKTVEMIDSAADMLSQMEMDGSTASKAPAETTEPVNAFTAQLMGQGGRVYACKIPEKFSFGGRGRGRGRGRGNHFDKGTGRGRGGRGGQMNHAERSATGRGRGRGRGRGGRSHDGETEMMHVVPEDSTTTIASTSTTEIEM